MKNKETPIRGVILAGGHGIRMMPATKVTNKHMLPIINRPMVLYPLDTLKHFGVKEILIISGGNHLGAIADFLGDGSDWGVNLTYRVQKEAGGIAQALMLAEDFASGGGVMVILGDNVYDNNAFNKKTIIKDGYASIFTKNISQPERFGVFDKTKNLIVEKPKKFISGIVVTGLYYYPNDVFKIIKTLKPSSRGELEITDVNNIYLEKGRISINCFDGFWSDAGTPESMLEVINWVWQKKKNHGSY